MNQSAISVRYAKALFEAASEAGKLEQVVQDMTTLENLFSELPEFTVFVESPVITARKKVAFFNQISTGFDDLSVRFLEMITRSKRESFLRMMLLNFVRFYRKSKGIMEAALVTAGEINKDTQAQFKKSLESAYKSDVKMDHQTDEDLIGGFVLRIEDEQLDASIATQLKKIKRELDQTLMQNTADR